jgi:hypothetical protein
MEVVTEKKIEIVEPIKPEVKPLPTKSDLEGRGFTASEIESAEKRGMVAKEEKKIESKDEEKKPVGSEEGLASEKEVEKDKFKHSQQFKEADLTADQESKLRELFPFVNGKMNPVESIYWRMKNERKSRQKAEAERKALEEEIKILKQSKPAPEKTVEPEVDEDGNPIDPEEKPITAKQLREMREREEAESQAKQEELRKRGEAVAESLRDQEEYAKSVYGDFVETVNLAKDLMQNLEEYLPDAKMRNKAIALIRDLQVKAAKADEFSLEDFNAADISYEIGKLHPEYGKKKEVIDPKANGGFKSDKVKRVEETTQRRGSSAGVNGGSGRRTVSPDEVTREDLAKMDFKQRDAFKKSYPDQYASLLWG